MRGYTTRLTVKRLLRFWAALAAMMAAAAFGAPPAPEPAGVPWTFFSLQAEGLAGRVTVDVRVESLPATVQAQFMPSPRGAALRPCGTDVLKLSVATRIDIIGGKALRLENHLWLDPQKGTPLYLERTRSGLEDYAQRFRFTEDGVFRRQREPASAKETEGAPESWTRLGQHFYPYPPSEENCTSIIEVSTLIPLFTGSAVKAPDPMGPVCLFHKRQLHRLSCRPEAAGPVAFDYLEKREGFETRRSGTAAARKIQVRTRPIGSYRGDVEELFDNGVLITLSPDGRLPLMASGKLPLIGWVDLKLKEIHFK